MMMSTSIQRITKVRFKDYVNYLKNKYPVDIWEFEIPTLKGRVENNWKWGTKLFINDIQVDINKDLMAIKGTEPLLTFKDENHEVNIYLRAIFVVKIKVMVNGKMLSQSYL